ncbi:glycoside hydrolase [Neurospora crassa]|nr:glycoside hydrolase [Neurospora crassa]
MRSTIFRAATALMAILTPIIVTAANPLQIRTHINGHTLSPRATFAYGQGNTTDVIIRTEIPRLIIYFQTTHDESGKPISMLPLVTEKNIALTHLIVCSLHIQKDGNITLNDQQPTDPRYGTLWQETQILGYAGVKIMGMIGGAAAGSFTPDTLDSANETVFNRYYGQLHETIKRYGLQGLDIDVEQPMSQGGIERLILRLRADFGKDFIITLAPVASALTMGGWNLSGFDYRKLMLAPSGAGKEVAFYNCQFYSGFGDAGNPNQFHQIITDNAQRDMRGALSPTKIVIGQLTNPNNGGGFVNAGTLANSIKTLRDVYGQIGGVAGWEYFNGQPGGVEEPWKWAQTMTAILRPNQVPKLKLTVEMAAKLKDVWKESAAAGMRQVVEVDGVEKSVNRTLAIVVVRLLDPDDADDVFAFVVLQIPHFRRHKHNHQQRFRLATLNVDPPSNSPSTLQPGSRGIMAWASSFSRPTKSDAIPPPYYLLSQFQSNPEEPYCKGCGKLIDPKRTFGTTGAPASTAASQKQGAGKSKGFKRGGKDQDKEDEKPGQLQQQEVSRFCTSRCRSESQHKKRDVKEQEKQIEETYVKLLQGQMVDGMDQLADGQADGKKKGKNGAAKPKKGEGRVVTLEEVETIVFGREKDADKVYGRKKNRKSRVLTSVGPNDEDTITSTDEESQSTSTKAGRPSSRDSAIGGIQIDALQLGDKAFDDEIAPLPKGKSHPYTTGGHEVARLAVRSGTRIRPPQEVSEVNGSVGGEKGRAERKAESEEMKEEIRQKKAEGDRKAQQKEMIKSVARRGVVFGFDVSSSSPDGQKKTCECVMPGGKVVEPHFAKGNWGIRWRGD